MAGRSWSTFCTIHSFSILWWKQVGLDTFFTWSGQFSCRSSNSRRLSQAVWKYSRISSACRKVSCKDMESRTALAEWKLKSSTKGVVTRVSFIPLFIQMPVFRLPSSPDSLILWRQVTSPGSTRATDLYSSAVMVHFPLQYVAFKQSLAWEMAGWQWCKSAASCVIFCLYAASGVAPQCNAIR